MDTDDRIRAWLLRAEALRQMAANCGDGELRLALEIFADDYDLMADEAEERQKRKRLHWNQAARRIWRGLRPH